MIATRSGRKRQKGSKAEIHVFEQSNCVLYIYMICFRVFGSNLLGLGRNGMDAVDSGMQHPRKSHESQIRYFLHNYHPVDNNGTTRFQRNGEE